MGESRGVRSLKGQVDRGIWIGGLLLATMMTVASQSFPFSIFVEHVVVLGWERDVEVGGLCGPMSMVVHGVASALMALRGRFANTGRVYSFDGIWGGV